MVIVKVFQGWFSTEWRFCYNIFMLLIVMYQLAYILLNRLCIYFSFCNFLVPGCLPKPRGVKNVVRHTTTCVYASLNVNLFFVREC